MSQVTHLHQQISLGLQLTILDCAAAKLALLDFHTSWTGTCRPRTPGCSKLCRQPKRIRQQTHIKPVSPHDASTRHQSSTKLSSRLHTLWDQGTCPKSISQHTSSGTEENVHFPASAAESKAAAKCAALEPGIKLLRQQIRALNSRLEKLQAEAAAATTAADSSQRREAESGRRLREAQAAAKKMRLQLTEHVRFLVRFLTGRLVSNCLCT